ncbi:PREDICTED: subtilisin-like protease SBT4.4 [Prunus mume]|uniref:Subtilisin-like protease SBT4.4 n=2 Tax=Prunus mume TaxID=102107 RepID=A0ABM0PWV9_PRUMU|nr:PREDICTED: subtilisin-like protease SBT4.4 [Prunus mume]
MAKHGALLYSYAFPILALAMSLLCTAIDEEDRKVHIVYLGSLPSDELYSPLSHQLGILERVVQGSSAANVLVRSYGRSLNGFAAKLTNREREKLANMKEVVSVFPSTTFQLHTTRSWDFMGFIESISRSKTVESNVVMAVIDSGIWPESDSFKDDGFGPPPKTWKGACQGGQNFTCNNKIIGARFYTSEESARDEIGHGSHTASTAAGNAVKDVSFYGLARGTARGGVPAGRIAAYNVCTNQGCSSVDILAAFDDCVDDGVSLITISIGRTVATSFETDPIAIGAFHAMKKGILTVQSAGNSGPGNGTVSSGAPWILTVAASSIDRKFITKAVLGNETNLVGISVNSFESNESSYPLIYGKKASKQCSEFFAGYCLEGCLDPDLVKEKIVLCDWSGGYVEVDRAGAKGAILSNSRDDVASVVPLSATGLNNQEYAVAKSYQNSTRNPRAKILKSEVIKDPAAPRVASFSSRGPNRIVPEILKPDITGPGIDIVAAYSPNASISASPYDERRVKYNVLSGTSMSCPHAAGVAAYVKEFHSDWSPAAIKSAIMTTAWPMNDTSTSPGEFAYGSGHLNPVRAINPGLVYEASEEDYIKFLCMMLDEEKIRLISGDKVTCPTGSDKGSPKDLNYPSMAANVTSMKLFMINFHRRVKNVGLANSNYKALISSNSKVDIKVVPEVLSFKSLNEEKNFTVTVDGRDMPEGSHVSASLCWYDGSHNCIVRSPIVISSVSA